MNINYTLLLLCPFVPIVSTYNVLHIDTVSTYNVLDVDTVSTYNVYHNF